MRSFWIAKKELYKREKGQLLKVRGRQALQYTVRRPRGEPPRVEFEIFEPKNDKEVPRGTVTRAKATCPCCNIVLSPERVRAQLSEQRGGADVVFDRKGQRIGGARLLAVVTLRQGERGRNYRLATDRDYESVWRAQKALEKVAATKLPSGLNPVPDEPTPAGGGSGAGRAFSVQKYGMMKFGDLFTARQKLALVTFAGTLLSEHKNELIALTFSRLANACASLCRWHESGEKLEGVYSRQALPVVWDFCEGNPFSDATGGYDGAIDWVARVVEAWPGSQVGQVQIADACSFPLPDDSSGVWFTDPPYYDAVPYADLSDFFLVWLKRTLPGHPLLRDPFDSANPLTPKTREAFRMRSSW